MTIGLVLNNLPKISETFLVSKIKGLQNHGADVILFAKREQNIKCFNSCRVEYQRGLFKSKLLQAGMILFFLSKLFIRRPSVVFRYLSLEKKDDIKLMRRIKNLYINSHILNEDLDWIHFSYATLMIRRENIAGALKAKMGVSFRGYDISIYPLKHKFCYQIASSKIHKIHSISKDLLNISYDVGFNRNIPAVIINPSIDTNHFKIKRCKASKDGKINFLTVARLHWKKGIEYTLESLSLLKKQGFRFKYTIIGSGEEFERLVYATYQLNLDHDVIFVGDVIHSDIKKYYENAEIYLQYSIQEGFCNSVLEAQAMGLLTIVSNAEGLSENIIDKQTGFVVEKRSPELLARKIKFVLSIPTKKAAKIRTNAALRVQHEFAINDQGRKFSEFFGYK